MKYTYFYTQHVSFGMRVSKNGGVQSELFKAMFCLKTQIYLYKNNVAISREQISVIKWRAERIKLDKSARFHTGNRHSEYYGGIALS